VVVVWSGNGVPNVTRVGLTGSRSDTIAKASDHCRRWARNVEMLRAKLGWAHLCGLSGVVVAGVSGGCS
jgi:hypothetical protein